MYEPTNLKRWTMPRDYFGATWPNHYSAGVGQSRDSDCLEQSNFTVMLAEADDAMHDAFERSRAAQRQHT
jgi:hypothetical protein